MTRIAAWLKNSDERMLYYLNLRIRCDFLDRWMKLITHLGGAVFTIALALALALFTHLGWNAVFALAASHMLVHVLKKSFSRKRPYMTDGRIWVQPNPLQDYSFPSGHTTAIFSVAMTLVLELPWTFFIVIPIASMVGVSRIYLGLHYPTDVGIGAIIGTLFAIVVHIM
ncbi:phosphatase PAP2 family protein [Ferviditalea candida]|uniref:Phosphatase PAP2 family protein n=1 Tax=Ferviditalea candida TaxID=3108399 RepID=A0ABU5ZMQ0_9BACL|nr:phosphatase PAP2 family protein [Paenibacillaceae bacterium T2]